MRSPKLLAIRSDQPVDGITTTWNAQEGGESPAASRRPFGERNGPSPIFRVRKASLVQTGCPSVPLVLDPAPPFPFWLSPPSAKKRCCVFAEWD